MSKFYKEGFFLEQSELNDRIEITDEYWQELLTEQNKGKIIYANENGYPLLKDMEFNERDLLNLELEQLNIWFEEYDNQCKQYNRCIRLNEEFDKNINVLDNDAKIKAARIKEIRNLLKK